MTYFIIGIIVATIGLSLLNGIAEFIEVFFEYLKCFFAIKITEYNTKIQNLTSTQEDSSRAIGFTISTEEDEFNDD